MSIVSTKIIVLKHKFPLKESFLGQMANFSSPAKNYEVSLKHLVLAVSAEATEDQQITSGGQRSQRKEEPRSKMDNLIFN